MTVPVALSTVGLVSWAGGVKRYACELAARLGDYDVEVHLIDPMRVTRSQARSAPPAHLSSTRGRVPFSQLVEAMALARDRRSTILHRLYYTGPPMPRRTTVVTVHDMIAERFPGSGPRLERIVRRKGEWVARAELILAPSQSTRNDLCEAYRVPPERVVLTSLGVDRPEAEPPDANSRKPQILWIGNRWGYKNFTRFVEACAIARPAATLVCVGGAPLGDDERRSLAAAGLEVEQVSPSDEELFALLQQASMLAYPSAYEGFGLPVLEAMANGCPVLAGRGGSLPEVCGDAALLVDHDDAESIADGLERLLVDTSLRTELARRGRARSAQFGWDRTARQTAAAYSLVG